MAKKEEPPVEIVVKTPTDQLLYEIFKQMEKQTNYLKNMNTVVQLWGLLLLLGLLLGACNILDLF